MGCGCCSCGECMIFLSGSPGKSGSSSVDVFPDNNLVSSSFFVVVVAVYGIIVERWEDYTKCERHGLQNFFAVHYTSTYATSCCYC